MRDYTDINKQLTEIFFVDKRVKLQQKLFRRFYDKIFPECNDFVGFLSTSGKDSMAQHAGNIVDRILFDSIWNGMQSLYYNLMN